MYNIKRYYVGLIAIYITMMAMVSAQQTQDCACSGPAQSRRQCIPGRSLNPNQCQQAGCCYDYSFFLFFSIRCFARDESLCREECNVPGVSRKSCGFGFDKFNCELQGCCFDPITFPYCYAPGNTPSQPFPTPAPFSPFPTASNIPTASQWSSWSVCPPCTESVSTRTRSCINAPSQQCVQYGISLQQQRQCSQGLCRAWGPWIVGACSVSCGRGISESTRTCTSLGRVQPPVSCYRTSTDCLPGACPSTTPLSPFRSPVGSWGRWLEWSFCPNSCSPGTQTRTRGCYNTNRRLTDPMRCAEAFPPSQRLESRPCNEEMCLSWTSWGPYSRCSETCGEGSTRYSLRSCATPPTRTRSTNNYENCRRHEIVCLVGPCPSLTNFQTFSSTTQPLPVSTVSSTARPISFHTSLPSFSEFTTSTRTTTTTTSTRPTTSTTFVERPSWQSWLPWSSCSENCRPGERVRIRKCGLSNRRQIFPPFDCGLGISLQNEDCNVGLCAQWNEWYLGSDCTVTCVDQLNPIEDGVMTWARDCKTKESVASPIECYIEDRPCKATAPCSDSRVITPGIIPTPEQTTESTTSTTIPTTQMTVPPMSKEPTISTSTPDGIFDNWGEWSTCSVTCGPGVQNRVRRCKVWVEPEQCIGTNFLSKSCYPRRCVDTTQSTTTPRTESSTFASPPSTTEGVKLIPWGDWTECSKSCSPGVQTRVRQCPPGTDPELCSLENEDFRLCNTDFCESWDEWTDVTCESCVDGLALRTRNCRSDEASHLIVPGDCHLNFEDCFPCEDITTDTTTPTTVSVTSTSKTTDTTTPTTVSDTTDREHKNWKPWGEWAACSSTCGAGIQTRQRECRPNTDRQTCVQGSRGSRECNTEYCQFWSSWKSGVCDKTCGGGTSMSTRTCSNDEDLSKMPSECYNRRTTCNEFSCESVVFEPDDPKLDILFLVDSSDYVDDCDELEEKTGFERPLRGSQLNSTIAPTYTRMKQYITDFVAGWRGISDQGTRISIQLFSKLCSPKTKSNLYVEKRFSESHKEFVTSYVRDLPYICGDYWLYWALQCSLTPVLTTPFGDRPNVPNVVIAMLSNAPTNSQPSDILLKVVLRKLTGKDSTVLAASATPLEDLSPNSRNKYEENMRKLSCTPGGESNKNCPTYLGSIWGTNEVTAAEKVRQALRTIGKLP